MGELWPLLVVFAAVWALQLWSATAQSQRFMREVRDLRLAGRTAIGVSDRSRFRSRTFVALSAGADDRVVRAIELGGITVLARPQPAEDLQGRDLSALAEESDGDRRTRAAAMAARTLLEAEPGTART